MTGAELLTRAATILQDSAHDRWPLPELVNWINDGQRVIVLAKPSANSGSVALMLAAGTLQSLSNPAHLALLRITRNLKAAGPPAVGGRIVRPTNRDALDAAEPSWHDPRVVKYARDVRQYVFDEGNPREFSVYPGNDGTGIVEAVVSLLPTALAASGDPAAIESYGATLALPEPYSVILLDYILYRAFSKDDIAAEASRARLHYQAFAQSLGIKIQAEGATSPNAAARSGPA